MRKPKVYRKRGATIVVYKKSASKRKRSGIMSRKRSRNVAAWKMSQFSKGKGYW